MLLPFQSSLSLALWHATTRGAGSLSSIEPRGKATSHSGGRYLAMPAARGAVWSSRRRDCPVLLPSLSFMAAGGTCFVRHFDQMSQGHRVNIRVPDSGP